MCPLGRSPTKSYVGPSRSLVPSGSALSYLCERLTRREEEFVVHDIRFLEREERFTSLECEVQSVSQQIQALLQNYTRLKLDLSSRTARVASLTSHLASQDSRATVTPAELLAVTSERDRYHFLLSSLAHHFDSVETSLGHVVAEARSGRAGIQRSVAPILSEFRRAPHLEPECLQFPDKLIFSYFDCL